LLDTEFAMRDEDNNVKALFRQGQVLKNLLFDSFLEPRPQ